MKTKGIGYLIVGILFALLAVGPVISCIQLLYLVFVKHERVFGLQLAIPLAIGWFIVFGLGAKYSLYRFKKVRKETHNQEDSGNGVPPSQI
jgi:hypothetical protein